MDQIDAEHFMREAVLEGRKAVNKCKPNPPVGCVLVKNGKIIAKGHTNEPGKAHAEAMALAQLKGALTEVTAFVTLEPCSFHGRTPSCARELVQRKIGKVYVGMLDPHPGNRGAGIDILVKAGIPVELGILEKDVINELHSHLLKHSR